MNKQNQFDYFHSESLENYVQKMERLLTDFLVKRGIEHRKRTSNCEWREQNRESFLFASVVRTGIDTIKKLRDFETVWRSWGPDEDDDSRNYKMDDDYYSVLFYWYQFLEFIPGFDLYGAIEYCPELSKKWKSLVNENKPETDLEKVIFTMKIVIAVRFVGQK